MRYVILLLASAVLVQAASAGAIALRIRVFDGADEVTSQTRIVLFKAGDHRSAIAGSGGLFDVAPGRYDAQAIREQDGKVSGIRWAEGLVLQAYPDEAGRHLEIVNFQTGYGALEVRGTGDATPDAAIFAPGAHDKDVARRIDGEGYALFVVPAGVYDVRIGEGGRISWHPGIEVPADRTRFVLASQSR